jgi:dolichol-phosphate mannosyltransferase
MSASIELLTRPGPVAEPSPGTLPDAAATQPGLRAPELTIVVPTFNETANIAPLVERIAEALVGIDWEVIFVDDDSPDGTPDTVRDVARGEPRVRCLQRLGRRGLSSACIEGMLASSAPYLAVMDADLQHDERLLPKMLELLRADQADLAIGSRYTEGGSAGNFADDRVAMSRLATRLALAATRVRVADPMSGFFMLTAPLFRACMRDLTATGFKILLDLLASAPGEVRVRELPYRFGERNAGASKLDARAAWDYALLLLDKTVGRYIPTRFIVFSAVGALGVAVHMAVLALLFKSDALSFGWAQGWATLVAMTFNFALNNAITTVTGSCEDWPGSAAG